MGEPLLAPVLRLLEEGREREALALLQTPQEGLPEAERLALLGFLEGRKGDLRAYRALALEAAQRAQTPLTLYHLGLALPPKAGALALEEALRRFQGDAKGEARLHLALSLALERLGRPEALAHAALARLKDPSPWTTLHHLRLELLFGTKPFPEVLEEAEPFLPHPFPGVRMLAGHTLALTHLLRGSSRRAKNLLRGLLPLLEPPSLASFLVLGALALDPPEVRLLLEGAKAFLPREGWPWGFYLLARGLGEGDEAHLLAAHGLLREDGALYALLSEARLKALGVEVEAPLAPGLAPGLRPEARAFLLGQAEAPFLRLLGEGPLPSLGPRGTEALALLLAHEAGLSGEALGEALYGEPNPGALKALLHRLREVLLPLGPPPGEIPAFLDLNLGHEYAHAVQVAWRLRTGARWLDEFVANYLFLLGLRRARPDLAEGLLAWSEHLARLAPEKRRLSDYERRRGGLEGALWFQARFTLMAQALWEKDGDGLLLALLEAAPLDRKRGHRLLVERYPELREWFRGFGLKAAPGGASSPRQAP
jgi:hypothetical protein